MRGTPYIVLLLALFAVQGQSASEADLASFDQVWETIRDKHWDLASTGVDWEKSRDIYRARAETAANSAMVAEICNEMVGQLGQSHFGVIGGGSEQNIESLMSKFDQGKGSPGFEVAVVDDRVFVINVDRDSQAAEKGIKVGTEIISVEKQALSEVVTKLKKGFAEMAHADFYLAITLNDIFSGDVGEVQPMHVLKKGRKKKVKLKLQEPKGQYQQLLNLPTVLYRFDKNILPQNIGYMAFNIFVPKVAQDYDKALDSMLETDGLIIDLRGNGGGLGVTSLMIANRLITEKGHKLGKMINKGGTMNLPIFPRNPAYDKPVALLIDGRSASTSEILAAGLQSLGRARIFGTRSAGAALLSVIDKLPNGYRFQYAIADYENVDGSKLEGNGVVPDVVTPHTVETLSKNQDAAMVAAIQWIENQRP